MSSPVKLGPQPQDKSYRGLFSAIHGDEQYVSGTTIPEALGSFRYIIENYGSGNNTVGSDESLFKQFHAWVSGTILYNSETGDASNNWTLDGLPTNLKYYQNFFSMSIQSYGDRYHSHLNHEANFRWMEGNEYTIFNSLGFTYLQVPFSGSYFGTPGGFVSVSSSCWIRDNSNQLGSLNDIGTVRCYWRDHYNRMDEISQSNGVNQQNVTSTFGTDNVPGNYLCQDTTLTHFGSSGGGGGAGG